jgi:hypothetical protein
LVKIGEIYLKIAVITPRCTATSAVVADGDTSISKADLDAMPSSKAQQYQIDSVFYFTI